MQMFPYLKARLVTSPTLVEPFLPFLSDLYKGGFSYIS